VPIILKSGRLKPLEPEGLVQACNGIALPLPAIYAVYPSGMQLPEVGHIMWSKCEGAENNIFWAKIWKWGTLFFFCVFENFQPPATKQMRTALFCVVTL
jgi:hypothetical protein